MSDVETLHEAMVAAHKKYRDRVGKPRTILGSPEPVKEELDIIVVAFGKMDIFRQIDGWTIWAKGRQQTITAAWLAEWSFPRWHFGEDSELAKDAEKVCRLISTRSHPTTMFTAVWGAHSDTAVEIGGGLSIQPFSTLQSRDAQDWASGSFSAPNRFLGGYQSALNGPPGAAIVITDNDFPFLSGNHVDQLRRSQQMIDATQMACLSLEVFGTGHPIIDISWFECRDDEINAIWLERVRFWRQPEVVPLKIEPMEISAERLAAMHGRLTGLPPTRLAKLIKSIRRFELSLARRDAGDQAIDLCTAFEQILGGGSAPISLKNALRCAALLGGSPKDRLYHRDIFEALYVVRNNVVHGGHAAGDIKMHTTGKIPVDRVIQEARSIYCQAIEKLVLHKDEPHWFELETCPEGVAH